ncbi:zona pellucida sperm-binding protein 3d.2 [Polymixia lowei]
MTPRFGSLNDTTTVLKQTGPVNQMRKDPAVLPPPYLQLPVFLHSRLPLVEKENFSPTSGTGDEQLPDAVREVLLPVAPTQRPATASVQSRGVITVCNVDKMRVQVQKSALGFDGKSSKLKLGTCKASKSTTDFLYFEYDLGLCGSKRTIIDNRVAYSNTLRYEPLKRPEPIRRAVPFTLPVTCHYNRYQYSYKIGYKPKIQMRKIFKPMKHRAKFILTPRNGQWERLSPSDQYVIGKPMYFEAEAPSMSKNKRLYIQSCHVTFKRSHNSVPQFTVVENFGCMVESKDSHSRFIPYKNHVVRFTLDAFLFKGMTGQQLYMHCAMSVGGSTPTPTSKSCNYDTEAGRWQELYGSASVCSCCDSKCVSTAPTVTKMISSRPWTMEYQVKATTAPKRKMAAATTTTTKPKEIGVTVGKVEKVVEEFDWPFGGGGVEWVEGEAVDKPVKGFAVVEEEQGSEPRRIFEDIFVLDK